MRGALLALARVVVAEVTSLFQEPITGESLVLPSMRYSKDKCKYKMGLHLYFPTLIVDNRTVDVVKAHLFDEGEGDAPGTMDEALAAFSQHVGVPITATIDKLFDDTVLCHHHHNGLRVPGAPKYNDDGSRDEYGTYGWKKGWFIRLNDPEIVEPSHKRSREEVLQASWFRRPDGTVFPQVNELTPFAELTYPAPEPAGPAESGKKRKRKRSVARAAKEQKKDNPFKEVPVRTVW